MATNNDEALKEKELEGETAASEQLVEQSKGREEDGGTRVSLNPAAEGEAASRATQPLPVEQTKHPVEMNEAEEEVEGVAIATAEADAPRLPAIEASVSSSEEEEEEEDYVRENDDLIIKQLVKGGFKETKPIDTLDELLTWTIGDNCRPANYLSAKAPRKRIDSIETKTLICHDMKGGYLDDRFTEGTDDHHAYRFYNWSAVDYFCYFSHRFVTIPPLPWIQAAHRHGVSVLGTLITEFGAGSQICEKMLESKESAEKAAEKLVEVAEAYGFEGWLLNIECGIKRDQMDTLVHFIRYLTEKCHEKLTDGFVIWYDSVNYPSGSLMWQNALTQTNKVFFDACDGIFLNYGWGPGGLQKSKELAGDRYRDIYVGIDVFGRGCYGGGGWNTSVAVNEILEKNLSIALFAPGWTHENLPKKKFIDNDHKYWIKAKLPVTHVPVKLPLITSFCQGFGKQLHKRGQVVSEEAWHNLFRQQLQPTNVEVGRARYDVAYDGGSCLELISSKKPLFQCHISLEPEKKYSISVIWMGVPVAIDLKFSPESDLTRVDRITLDSDGYNVSHPSLKSVSKNRSQLKDELDHHTTNHGNESPLSSCFRSLRISENWRTTSFDFEAHEPLILTEIMVKPTQASGLRRLTKMSKRVLLGHFKLVELSNGRRPPKRTATQAFGASD